MVVAVETDDVSAEGVGTGELSRIVQGMHLPDLRVMFFFFVPEAEVTSRSARFSARFLAMIGRKGRSLSLRISETAPEGMAGCCLTEIKVVKSSRGSGSDFSWRRADLEENRMSPTASRMRRVG